MASWQRVNPAGLLLLGQKGGIMLMATAAKQHVTIFPRRRHCRKPPGSPEVKAAFSRAARGTLGKLDRAERNLAVAQGVSGSGKGYTILRSKSKDPSKRGQEIRRIATIRRGG